MLRGVLLASVPPGASLSPARHHPEPEHSYGPVMVDVRVDRHGLGLIPAGSAFGPGMDVGGPYWSLPWSEVSGFAADDRTACGDGAVRQVVDVVVSGGRYRLLLSAPDTSVLFRRVACWARWWAVQRSGQGALPRTGAFSLVALLLGMDQITRLGQVARPAVRQLAVLERELHPGIRRLVVALQLDQFARLLDRASGGRRSPAYVASAFAAVLVVFAAFSTFSSAGPSAHAAPAHLSSAGGWPGLSSMAQTVSDSGPATPVSLPPATAPAEPAPPSIADTPALASHEMFGFAPYWTLPQSGDFDVASFTTLAYFSIDVNADGSLDESGTGWSGYESQDLVNLIDRSHSAGVRVVLTVTCFGQSTLEQITSSSSAPSTLAGALIPILRSKDLDGVNFDFEGTGSADRAGLTNLITGVSASLRAADSDWQVTMDTYASAAGDPDGFYNIAALAPAVDGFFVMAYDMDDPSVPGPTAPLVGASFTDTDAAAEYSAVVPASKVILGVPYYGYDWSTNNGVLGAQATGPPTPMSYSQILAAGNPTYWDPTTETAWTSYEVGNQWHETYFDDPTSLALKAELANTYHLAGLGVWALGMDGNDPAMLAALLGNAPVVKNLPLGPTSTPPSGGSTSTTTTLPSAGTHGYTYQATFDGVVVKLTPTSPLVLSPTVTTSEAGVLTQFVTDNPADSCLATGASLQVWSVSSKPGVYVVEASLPDYCSSGTWTIPIPAGVSTTTTTTKLPIAAPPTTTTTATPPSTTTTSVPPTTTTTTTATPPSTTTTSVPPTTTTTATPPSTTSTT